MILVGVLRINLHMGDKMSGMRECDADFLLVVFFFFEKVYIFGFLCITMFQKRKDKNGKQTDISFLEAKP